jgi:hypothetical protein
MIPCFPAPLPALDSNDSCNSFEESMVFSLFTLPQLLVRLNYFLYLFSTYVTSFGSCQFILATKLATKANFGYLNRNRFCWRDMKVFIGKAWWRKAGQWGISQDEQLRCCLGMICITHCGCPGALHTIVTKFLVASLSLHHFSTHSSR